VVVTALTIASTCGYDAGPQVKLYRHGPIGRSGADVLMGDLNPHA
jgi:hypothetical protein